MVALVYAVEGVDMNPILFFGSATLFGAVVCLFIPRIERVRVKYLLPWLERVTEWGRSKL